MKKALIGGATAAALGAIAFAAYAQVAAGGSAAPRLLPYVGHLDHDGVPVSGQVALKVCLVKAADTACSAAAWSEQFDQVNVAGGAFSLVLGQNSAIPDDIWKSGSPVFVRAMVGATALQGSPTFVQLSGAQRVLSVPYAVNVDAASSLRVDGPIARGSVSPSTDDLGLYSGPAGQPIRLVTNGGDIRFNADGASNNGVGSDAATLLAVSAAGVKVGKSVPFKYITNCSKDGNYDFVGWKEYTWVSADCDAGLPAGKCFAYMGRMNECGNHDHWTAWVPGDNAAKPNGYVSWWGEACGGWKIQVTYVCY